MNPQHSFISSIKKKKKKKAEKGNNKRSKTEEQANSLPAGCQRGSSCYEVESISKSSTTDVDLIMKDKDKLPFCEVVFADDTTDSWSDTEDAVDLRWREQQQQHEETQTTRTTRTREDLLRPTCQEQESKKYLTTSPWTNRRDLCYGNNNSMISNNNNKINHQTQSRIRDEVPILPTITTIPTTFRSGSNSSLPSSNKSSSLFLSRKKFSCCQESPTKSKSFLSSPRKKHNTTTRGSSVSSLLPCDQEDILLQLSNFTVPLDDPDDTQLFENTVEHVSRLQQAWRESLDDSFPGDDGEV